MNDQPTDAAALQSAVAQSRDKTPGLPTVVLAADAGSLAPCLIAFNALGSISIVATRGLCDALNIESVLSGQRQPSLAVSRGLDADLAWCCGQRAPTLTAIDLAIVERAHSDECGRVGNLVRMLGGYALDPAAWQPAVDAAVAGKIAGLMTVRSDGVILVGQQRYRALLRLWPGCTIVEVGPQVTATRDAAEQTIAAGLSSDDDTRAPSVEDVAGHARFMVAYDCQTLRSLHAGLDPARFADVYAVWQANLSVLATQAPHRDLALRAATALATLTSR